VVINCAGPFCDTAETIAAAAIRVGSHYVDMCAEQMAAKNTLEKMDEPARSAGVTIVPSMAFYGGLTDLMITAAVGEDVPVDAIDIMVGLSSWHPTPGTRNTISSMAVGDGAITDGRVQAIASPRRQRQWNFGLPLGEHTMVEVPFSETVLVARHLKTMELHNYVSASAVAECLDPATPEPVIVDESGSHQRFVVETLISRAGERHRSIVQGRDAYAISAPMACEAAQRLIDDRHRGPGAHTPGEAFDAADVLLALGLDYASYDAAAV
jgi:short subunit dehydrogenase-like uncharacterized protein